MKRRGFFATAAAALAAMLGMRKAPADVPPLNVIPLRIRATWYDQMAQRQVLYLDNGTAVSIPDRDLRDIGFFSPPAPTLEQFLEDLKSERRFLL